MQLRDVGTLVVESALGNGKEAAFATAAAALGFVANNYLGGWDSALKMLIFLMVLDYVTGMLKALKTHTVSSNTMFWGGLRKGVVITVIALASLCDQWVGGDSPVFRILAIYFYAGREGLSVVENLDGIGVPLPGALTKFLEQLQEKGQGDGR